MAKACGSTRANREGESPKQKGDGLVARRGAPLFQGLRSDGCRISSTADKQTEVAEVMTENPQYTGVTLPRTESAPAGFRAGRRARCGQGVVTVDQARKTAGEPAPVVRGVEHVPTAGGSTMARSSEGRDDASVAGCNANNANAGRTCNCNNAVSNGNDNYARGFAESIARKNGKHPTSRATSPKTKKGPAATGGQGRGEYGTLPFWGDAAESSAQSLHFDGMEPDMGDAVWKDLESANNKRNLKSLRRFYLNINIALLAVKRATEKQDTAEKREYYGTRRRDIAEKMVREIADGTYRPMPIDRREIHRSHESDKHRTADVSALYDRCVQMMVYIVCGRKWNRLVPRQNYSNTPGRGILCRDRRYCMVDRVKTAAWKYRDLWVATDDIRKFYQSLAWQVVMGVVMESTKDPTTLRLLSLWLSQAGSLPIGMCLSPVLSDMVLAEHDRLVLRRFPAIRFMAAFGDNRLYVGPHDTVQQAVSWDKSYHAGRYGLDVKGDYQVWRVADGFRFCKTWYSPRGARVRGEMRRRAVTGADKERSWPSYYGLLVKTDASRLLWMIRTDLRRLKMRDSDKVDKVSPLRFSGEPVKFDEFVGKKVCIVDFARRDNGKESKFYYRWQYVALYHGREMLCVCDCGSHELKQVGDKWLDQHTPMPQYVTIGRNRTSIYFVEYHKDNGDLCEETVREMGVDLSLLG